MVKTKEDKDGNIFIDFKDATSRRKSKRQKSTNIERFYASRYRKFIKVGFTPSEAEWAAGQGLHFGLSGVRKVANIRKTYVKNFMKRLGISRQEAIEKAYQLKVSRIEGTGLDEDDIFVSG